MAENTTSLGVWIRVALEAMGKNQAWLADKVGVQPPQISRIISGGSDPTPDILVAIADALGKPRVQAFRAAGYIEQTTELESDIEELIGEAKKMSKIDREEVTAFIRMKNNLRRKK